MPELTVTVRVPLPKQPTLASLERVIFRALLAAERELLLQAFGMLEGHVVAGAKQRRRRRYLLTRFGEIRYFRWQTRTDASYGYPLDEALGLAPGDPCSAWVRNEPLVPRRSPRQYAPLRRSQEREACGSGSVWVKLTHYQASRIRSIYPSRASKNSSRSGAMLYVGSR